MFRSLHQKIRTFILSLIDVFYPIFKKWMPLQTYRYAACGGGTTFLNILIYFISYNFVLKKEIVHFSFIAISPHIAAFIIAFFLTFPIGYYLNTFVVFQGSYLKKRIQLFRYFLVVCINILLNYLFIKIFVEKFGWYPTPSAMATNAILIVFSYFSQRNFSFRKEKISFNK
nr:GtrA family protein [Pseudopedobacter sp.]